MNLKGLLAGILLTTVIPLSGYATHVVGGSITYEHLGGSSYRLTYKMYRDCDPGNAQFPGTVNLRVTDGNGVAYSTVSIPFPGEDTLNPHIDTCAFNPGICVAQAIYTTVVNNLYPGNGGYHIYYQYCCRNWSITNVPVTPGVTGTSYHTYIPDNAQVLTNSSPLWVNYPPVFVCGNQPLNFDHSATDPDGDSLAYKLYHPFENDPAPPPFNAWGGIAPTWPGFNLAPYNAGYDAQSPLEPSSPAQTLLIDVNTGLMDYSAGANPIIGQHVVGIMVEEWRNGQLLNIVYRDFQFNVLNCPPPVIADIGPVDPCNGAAVDMINNSTGGATTWEWDFGDGSPVSSQFEPTHSYGGIGPYTIQLVADPGTNCSDTTTLTIDISFTNADFTYTDSVCINTPLTFNDATTVETNASVNQWFWDFGDGNTSTLPNPTHTYTTSGNFTVQLIAISDIGCIDTIQQPMYVQGLPTVSVGPDTTACVNNPLITLNGTITNASGGLWLGQGGSFTPNPNTLNANYSPSPGELGAGSSMLILSSQGNGFCPASTDTVIITYVPGPTVDAGPDLNVCSDTTSIPMSGTVQVAGGGQWTTTGTGSFSPANDDLNALYLPTSADTAAGSIIVYLTTTMNGNCVPATDSMIITFFDPPTVAILGTDTSCTGDAIALDGNTSTGDGYWETLGSGNFSPNDSTVQVFYQPSAADEAAGTVTVIFHTLSNGGCQQQHDTLDIDILPAPNPAFTFTDVCFNEVTTFTNGSTPNGDPITGYLWDYGDGNNSTVQDPSYTFGAPGPQNVSLIVFSQNGCTDTITQSVPVHYLPNVNFLNNSPCVSGGSQFTDLSTAADTSIVSWMWNFGDGNSDTAQHGFNWYQTPGVYNVTLVATTAYGCIDSVTIAQTILPGPTAAFTASDTSVNLFEVVQFTDQSTPQSDIISWEWDFDNGVGSSTNQNPAYSWDTTGVYDVMLVVTDTNGCTDTAWQEIVVFMPPEVPTAFSPNGDGVNDYFSVYGGPFDVLEFRVYNNWGQLIFESVTNNSVSGQVGWDGTYDPGCLCNGGVDQPLGVFVWTVNAVTFDGVVHEKSGDVTLLR